MSTHDNEATFQAGIRVERRSDGALVYHVGTTVLLYDDGGRWFAQSLEIDHFADGSSEEEVKANFANSFKRTVQEHLHAYESLVELVNPAPSRFFLDFLRLQAGDNRSVPALRPANEQAEEKPAPAPKVWHAQTLAA